ncbi:MAG: glycosyl hydrolase [Bacteroidota bacterium]
MINFIIRCFLLVVLATAFNANGQTLKSIVYDFDGLDIGQTDLPEGDYQLNDLNYSIAANPLGESDMLGDRVLQLNLNAGNGTFGRGISRFIEFDPSADVFHFYFYNPIINSADATVEVALSEDDDQSDFFSIGTDDVWVKSIVIPRNAGWQLISVPLNTLIDSNPGGNGVFDAAFTQAKGMLLFVEFNFTQNSPDNAVYYIDMIAFAEGAMPTGTTILDIPHPVLTDKCPLGAFQQKASGNQHLVPSAVEGLFPTIQKKIKYVNWFLQFAMDGSTTANVFPGNEVKTLLTNGYTPVITWEPLYTGYARLDPVQPRLSNIINGEFDTYIDAFADTLKSYNDTVIIRFMHEFEGDWYPWSITHNNQDPSNYITAFRKVVDRFRARGATKVKWMWCTNADYAPYEAYNWIVPAYPGDNYVDIIATDIYNNHFPVNSPWWMSFKYKAIESYYYLTKYFPQKTLFICEEGCRERASSENATSQTKADWLSQMDKELKADFTKVRALIFFDAITENDWRINSTSLALTSMETNIWNDDYYFESEMTAGIFNNKDESELMVYQSGNYLNFKAAKLISNENILIELFGMEGKKISSKTIKPIMNTVETKINIDGLATGNYLVRVSNNDFKRVVKAIVK